MITYRVANLICKKRKEDIEVMRRTIIACALVVMALSIAGHVFAQDKGISFSGGSDLVSSYIWRGVYEAGVSLQPTMTMSVGKFSATAWGSVDFASTSYKEMDLTLAYTIGSVTLSLADLYWEGGAGSRDLIERNYFTFDSNSPHRIEVGANWIISEKIPFTLSWYTILFGAADVNSRGERAYSSYFEVAYPFRINGVDMKAGVGMVPWNAYGTYGIDRNFYVQNIFLNAGKTWCFREKSDMNIGLFTHLIWNPALDDVNFVGGISFRM